MIYVPPWLRLAEDEMNRGVQERPGGAHNPRIIEYGTAVSLNVTTDEVPWCSNFINWLMRELSIDRTHSARARSWLLYGQRLTYPALGCVVVMKRGGPGQPGPDVIAAQGHVGLLTAMPEPGRMTILGGNQSNRVCEKTYPLSLMLDMRYPTTIGGVT
jgi:uncharacterized protein (TIGR02594 family)